jgi:hypothetical protein
MICACNSISPTLRIVSECPILRSFNLLSKIIANIWARQVNFDLSSLSDAAEDLPCFLSFCTSLIAHESNDLTIHIAFLRSPKFLSLKL